MHAVYNMLRSIATNVAHSMVCLRFCMCVYLYLCVGHMDVID